ncbi:hypothetical protein KP509_36G036800 [Ceratopteris richardii]|uniref:Uncharacterized protein n=1 Tax=Ceratopteris richardii TaxID=49495 RepID=A0A8T2QAX3_CERRI|nr:hypothetical protein KP509_36G036700 [Ceratopteris richardii]KAH7281237.1 hypothetical protein KP509_36G036800 [Ceratopteris richardii]
MFHTALDSFSSLGKNSKLHKAPRKYRKRKSRAKPRPFVRELIAQDELSFRKLVIQFTSASTAEEQSRCPDGALSVGLPGSSCSVHGGLFLMRSDAPAPFEDIRDHCTAATDSTSFFPPLRRLGKTILGRHDRIRTSRTVASSSGSGRSSERSKVTPKPRNRKSRAKPKPLVRQLIALDNLNFKKLVLQFTGKPAEAERSHSLDTEVSGQPELQLSVDSGIPQEACSVKHDFSVNKTLPPNAYIAGILKTIESISACLFSSSSDTQVPAPLGSTAQNVVLISSQNLHAHSERS